jgi:ribosomal-protein-serine acetyltransferase
MNIIDELSNQELHIRPYRDTDIQGMYDTISSSITEMKAFLPWVHDHYSIEDASCWVKQMQRNWESGLQYDFVIEDISRSKFLGGVGLLGVNRAEKIAFLGYWIRTDASKKGIATQAAQLAIAFAKNQLALETLLIECDIKNKSSIKVAEKLGARFFKRLKNAEMVNGKSIDKNIYQLKLTA